MRTYKVGNLKKVSEEIKDYFILNLVSKCKLE